MSMRRRGREAGREPTELAGLADGSLAPERAAALEASVAASPELSHRLDEQRRALALTRGAAAGVEAPPALRARVEAERRVRHGPAVRRRAVLGGAVVVAALGVALAALVVRSGTPSERFEAALAATPFASGATGRATLTKTPSGWRIDLRANGLPRLDRGRFYEAWLGNAAGMLVPVGTFNDGRSVTLWAGVSPKQFRTLTVTRERADGDQASSGEKVLVGTVATGS